MSLFESLQLKRQEKFQKESQDKEMKFQERQLREQSALQDDQLYLQEQDTKSDLIRWQQEFAADIQFLRYNFLGYRKNSNGNWIRDTNIKPLCNTTFFDQIIEPTCSFYLSRNFTNSNLSEDRINSLLKKSFNNLATTLVKKYKIYDIEFKNFDDIIRETKTIVVPAAFRALNGWTKKTDSTMHKSIEANHTGGQREKRGLFNIGG